MSKRYAIPGDSSEWKALYVGDAAKRYWESWPEYHKAKLGVDTALNQGVIKGYLVVAEFPRTEVAPEPIKAVSSAVEKQIRLWETTLFTSTPFAENYRVVFFHHQESMAMYFCGCVEGCKRKAIEEAFHRVMGEPGDGSVESQWGEVFE